MSARTVKPIVFVAALGLAVAIGIYTTTHPSWVWGVISIILSTTVIIMAITKRRSAKAEAQR